MTHPARGGRETLLLFEPRTEGHHLGWLRFLTEDLLSAEFDLSLAVDLRGDARRKIEACLAGLLPDVKLLSAYGESGHPHGHSKTSAVAFCLRQSGAENVFLCSLDEIASRWWRRAAFGFFPPAGLRGRVGGIYHRPRFMAEPPTLNGWLKQTGFRRLLQRGWLRQWLFLDEQIVRESKARFSEAPIFFLPTPCPPNNPQASDDARRELGVPLDRRIFLFYGTGAPRKGLPLAVEAMRGLPSDHPAFLLCAGQQNPEGATAHGLEELVRQGRAGLINRYVSTVEEELCFAASDIVLLPYLGHFGPSDILSRAMSAGKMVIVSDEQLLGRRTRQYGVGLLFTPGRAAELRQQIHAATNLDESHREAFAVAARNYAREFSRAACRRALLVALARREFSSQAADAPAES